MTTFEEIVRDVEDAFADTICTEQFSSDTTQKDRYVFTMIIDEQCISSGDMNDILEACNYVWQGWRNHNIEFYFDFEHGDTK